MYTQTDYAICNVPVAPIRAESTHRAEQISELLFGERAHILSRTGTGWVYISCEWDGYTGWIKESQLTYIPKKTYCKNLHFRSEEHTSELQSRENLVCRLLLEKKKK